MIGRPIRVLIPPERPREEEAILNRICRGEKVEHYESVRITKDGRRIDVSLTISPIRDAKDRIVGASKIARDITEHKRDLEQLRERERMLHEAQRLAQVGSWELDLDDPSDLRRGALRCSDECFRIFGYEPGQVAVNYDLFLQAVHPDDRDLVAAALARAVRGNAPYSIEHRIVRPDGTERVLFAWDKVITDSTGRPIRMVVTIQDITERKRAWWPCNSMQTGWSIFARSTEQSWLRARRPRSLKPLWNTLPASCPAGRGASMSITVIGKKARSSPAMVSSANGIPRDRVFPPI